MEYFSDAVLRVFSTDPVRQASADALKTYEAELASSKIQAPNTSDMGDLDKSKLPGIEALLNPGMSDKQSLIPWLTLLFAFCESLHLSEQSHRLISTVFSSFIPRECK
ncbi:hypothetical protein FBUS_03481 [Fasciolopsis buskii]|uniref:Uncharacterized protein n=1 Tax=Fasciolopsis buskii TaxID=27845 RepID=A0A8E0VQG8_9TREM|nr:hypothetical protein FBUS_03481 [Fasciolopsis buski]